MKIAPPVLLMPYITFENGKPVPKKPLPFFLKPAFKRYCNAVERADKRREKMFDDIAKNN